MTAPPDAVVDVASVAATERVREVPTQGEPAVDPATDRELRRMALIHRRAMLAGRPAVRRPR